MFIRKRIPSKLDQELNRLGSNTIFLKLQNPTSASVEVNLFKLEDNPLVNFGGNPETVSRTITGFNLPRAVAYNSTNNQYYLCDGGTDTVIVLNGDTFETITSISVGDFPLAAAFCSELNKVYIGNTTGSSVSVIDCSTNTVTSTIGSLANIQDIEYNSTNNTVYVTRVSSNLITVINCDTDSIVTSISTTSPFQASFDIVDNRMYVTNSSAASIAIIDCTNNTVSGTISSGLSGVMRGVAYNTRNNKLYSTNSGTGMFIIDTSTNTVSSTLTVGSLPREVIFNPDANLMYTINSTGDSTTIINCDDDSISSTVSVGDNPFSGVFNSQTGTMMITNGNDGTASVFGSSIIVSTNTSYKGLVYSLLGTPYKLNGIKIQSTSTTQILNTFDVNYRDVSGVGNHKIISPTIDPYQSQNTTQMIKLDNVIVDNNTDITYTLDANSTTILYFVYDSWTQKDKEKGLSAKDEERQKQEEALSNVDMEHNKPEISDYLVKKREAFQISPYKKDEVREEKIQKEVEDYIESMGLKKKESTSGSNKYNPNLNRFASAFLGKK